MEPLLPNYGSLDGKDEGRDGDEQNRSSPPPRPPSISPPESYSASATNGPKSEEPSSSASSSSSSSLFSSPPRSKSYHQEPCRPSETYDTSNGAPPAPDKAMPRVSDAAPALPSTARIHGGGFEGYANYDTLNGDWVYGSSAVERSTKTATLIDGVNQEESIENRSSVEHQSRSTETANGSSYQSCASNVHVYKRRKLRNSVALLSDGSSCSSDLDLGSLSRARYSRYLSVKTSTSPQHNRWKSSRDHASEIDDGNKHLDPILEHGNERCTLCGLEDSARRMLICDLCDESWHLICCGVEEPPVDQWSCQRCLDEERKVPLPPETLSEKFFYNTREKERKKMLREKLGPILYMLGDSDPYTSRVRLGDDFQAKIPDWEGPALECDDYFANPSELSPLEQDSLNIRVGVNGQTLGQLATGFSVGQM